MLTWALAHRRVVVGLSVLTVLSIVPLFIFVGKNFLPADDQSQYNVLVRTPEGTSLASTNNIAEQIARAIRRMPGVEHTLTTAGGSADRSVNNASIYVKLTDLDQRHLSQQDLMQRTRELLKQYPAGNPHQRGTGEHGGRQPEQRRRAVFHSGPRSEQAGAVLR